MMEKPDVESISGLSPAISIDQKLLHEIHEVPWGPSQKFMIISAFSTHELENRTALFADISSKNNLRAKSPNVLQKCQKEKRILILAPVVRGKKGEHQRVLENIRREGFVRMRIDGNVVSIAEEIELDPKKHTIEIVIDRLVIKNLGKNIDLPSGEKQKTKMKIETVSPIR